MQVMQEYPCARNTTGFYLMLDLHCWKRRTNSSIQTYFENCNLQIKVWLDNKDQSTTNLKECALYRFSFHSPWKEFWEFIKDIRNNSVIINRDECATKIIVLIWTLQHMGARSVLLALCTVKLLVSARGGPADAVLFVMPPPLGAGGIMFSGCPSVRPSIRPSEAWNNLFSPVHGSVGPSQILGLFWLSETCQIWVFWAFPGERMEGMAWNVACGCIVTTCRTD